MVGSSFPLLTHLLSLLSPLSPDPDLFSFPLTLLLSLLLLSSPPLLSLLLLSSPPLLSLLLLSSSPLLTPPLLLSLLLLS